jgi:hypothetical protein
MILFSAKQLSSRFYVSITTSAQVSMPSIEKASDEALVLINVRRVLEAN